MRITTTTKYKRQTNKSPNIWNKKKQRIQEKDKDEIDNGLLFTAPKQSMETYCETKKLQKQRIIESLIERMILTIPKRS